MFKALCFLGVGLALCLGSRAPAGAATPPREAVKSDPRADWPQAHSDIAPDPAVRFGRLANGMRYVLLRNATPSGQTSIRLRIGSGALEESEDQLGLAHFLEHMAFRGSTHIPPGELIKSLQRHGLAFGSDTNAFTSEEQTVYALDLPETDPGLVELALTVMRDTAGELTLDSKLMDTERTVVLSEERLGDSPAFRSEKAWTKFAFPGQLAGSRLPIGSKAVLEHAPRARLADYYRTNYRPERAALVVVGDFDVDAMEARIRAKFADWTVAGAPPAEPDYGAPAPRGSDVELFVETGAPPTIRLAWITPYDHTADTRARETRELIENVGFEVINRRLELLARSAQAPFIAASSERSNSFHSARITTIGVVADPDRWRTALEAAETVQRQVATFGVRQDEVDRELAEWRAKLEAEVAGAATRRTPELATSLVDQINEDGVYTSPAQDLALFDQATKRLTAAQVGAALNRLFQGSGPLLFMSSPKPIQGGRAAVAQALAAVRLARIEPPTGEAARSWPYTSFGPAGAVEGQRTLADLGVTFVRFANGVRLTVKPTAFRKDQIYVSARFGDGMLGLPRDRSTAAWAVGAAFSAGGLKALSLEQMQRVLASRIYSAGLSIGDDSFALQGATRPRDLELQMQVLAAYVTAPGWRPDGFERLRRVMPTALDQLETTPSGVFQRDGQGLLHSADARWVFPTRGQIAATRMDDVRRLLEPVLAKAPIELVVVGDVTVSQAISAVSATFGALPPRPPTTPLPSAQGVRFPAPTPAPVVLTDRGRADQGGLLVAWPTVDYFSDPQRARELNLASEIMQSRLEDQVRHTEGAAYVLTAQADESQVFPGFGLVAAYAEVPPDKFAGVAADVAKIASDMSATGVTADELERARKPHIQSLSKAMQTNEFWLGWLGGAQRDPWRLEAIRGSIAGYQKITPSDIQQVSRQYLRPDRAWKLQIRPEAQASAAPSPKATAAGAGAS